MPSFISRVLRFFLRLVFLGFASLFALVLLSVALVFLAVGMLTSLLTGRKPKPAMVFGRFQRFSSQTMWPGAGTRSAPTQMDIVDVETRDISEDRRLPPDRP